ncbi:hypothetical protein PM10SUCC1_32760 [Propionigenium maris DSM 9537]|uniref:HTH cro/C1-type domain-containing protein n=1 Tax=Propionigenium maris DSM 9537 TaxID=1123000 RepID=A0A9W6GPX0_9FUSO|nr:helix-turn-helix transcriptional regulator [Propionigenium maris]GLI57762.1 hypothetical protein PM10SUCC1_32760 [Propionigenium maris DSM 9537]
MKNVLGHFLKQIRKKEDLNLTTMARRLGIGTAELSGVESSKYRFDYELYRKIKREFNLSMDELQDLQEIFVILNQE